MKTIEVTLWFVLYFEEVTFARLHGVGWVGFEKLEKKVRRRAITTAKSSRRPTLEKLHLKYLGSRIETYHRDKVWYEVDGGD